MTCHATESSGPHASSRPKQTKAARARKAESPDQELQEELAHLVAQGLLELRPGPEGKMGYHITPKGEQVRDSLQARGGGP